MQPSKSPRTPLTDDEFRDALRRLVATSGRSARSLSLAMRRDRGYVSALLDPTRPSRARPNPDDLLALSDATAIPFIELLEVLWGVSAERLRAEVARQAPTGATLGLPESLEPEDRQLVADFVAVLERRRAGRPPGR